MFHCLNKHIKYQINIWNVWSIFHKLVDSFSKVFANQNQSMMQYTCRVIQISTESVSCNKLLNICTLCSIFARNIFSHIYLIHPIFASFFQNNCKLRYYLKFSELWKMSPVTWPFLSYNSRVGKSWVCEIQILKQFYNFKYIALGRK